MSQKLNLYGAFLLGAALSLIASNTLNQVSQANPTAASPSSIGNSFAGTWVAKIASTSTSIYLPHEGDRAYVMPGLPGSQEIVYEIPITQVSRNWELPEGVAVMNLEEEEPQSPIEAMQAEAKTYTGTLNRAQQAFYLENSQFSSDLDGLGIGIQAETENYSYSIPKHQRNYVVNTAQSKNSDLKSYVGIVFVPESAQYEHETRVVFCESQAPGQSIPNIANPWWSAENVFCPPGFEELRQ